VTVVRTGGRHGIGMFHAFALIASLFAFTSAPDAFVKTNGREFVLEGRTFRLVGVNIRGITHYGLPQQLPVRNA